MQWLAVDNDGQTSYRITDRQLIATNENAPSTRFSLSDSNLQLRYKYELAPLSDLFIVYGEAGEVEFEDGQYQGSASSLLDLSRDNTTTKNGVVKVRYHF